MKDVKGKRGFYWFNGSLYFTFKYFSGVIGRNNRTSGEPLGFAIEWSASPKSNLYCDRLTKRRNAKWINFAIGDRGTFYKRVRLRWQL